MKSADPTEVTSRMASVKALPGPEEFRAMIRLLDDETPEVRQAVLARISEFDGDVSELLSECGLVLDAARGSLLSQALASGRRRRIQEEWFSPCGGAAALADDWDHFECLLRMISDFLHDGVTLRQSLSDAMDLLAEEAGESGVMTPDGLRVFLFESGTYVGNVSGMSDPRNLDLAWVAETGRGDALALSMLYLLVARRLDLEVEPVDYPGHFFCRIHEGGDAYLVDCFDCGKSHPLDRLLRGYDLGSAQKRCLATTVGPGTVLLRVLDDLFKRLKHAGHIEDAETILALKERL